ncbi:MAG: phage holin family protein [Verrucomicrobiia bacterium]
MSEPSCSASASLSGGLKNLISAAIRYFSLRLELASIEAGDAGRRLLLALVCLLGAALCLIGGYIGFVAAAIGVVVWATGWPLGWVGLAAAGVHLFIGVLLLLGLLPLRRGLFPETLAQVGKDREWLKTKQRETTKSNA